METITRKYEIRELSWPEKTIITRRARKAFDQLSSFFAESYGAIFGALGKLGVQPAGPPCAIYYSVNEAKKEADLAAAVPVKESPGGVKDFDKVIVPASKVISTQHAGPYNSMTAAYTALENYLTTHGLKKKMMIEEYLSDPVQEKEPSKWKTNIYFVVE